MTENPLLAAWAAICAAPVVGPVGHHITCLAGPAHPLPVHRGGLVAPPWVTLHGCDVAVLHATYSARIVLDRRGEDRECHIGRLRRLRLVKGSRPTLVSSLAETG